MVNHRNQKIQQTQHSFSLQDTFHSKYKIFYYKIEQSKNKWYDKMWYKTAAVTRFMESMTTIITAQRTIKNSPDPKKITS